MENTCTQTLAHSCPGCVSHNLWPQGRMGFGRLLSHSSLCEDCAPFWSFITIQCNVTHVYTPHVPEDPRLIPRGAHREQKKQLRKH